ncbi:thiamine pyrophosphate-dependent dehydrogenase E1 component subunit alpha [Anaeroarcus burkinensis]|uniref:thiamine pyrophosphate-dependent dehydrogenase E1 component subunit alpha n=1 Tax=Anaeroarcus burkinensis TaxID=82376 RepID=UPI00041E34F2|nr:thiamine pyrophosphate-dependent dehydrogenase E1 component subunit alpha [Anaeroarcus burkinensis]
MLLNQAYAVYETMLKIRLVEETIVREYPKQQIRTPVHLYVGEEAIAASISILLTNEDYIVSNHRSHGHCLAKGLDLLTFFKELYGKRGGCSNGMGGSMHLCDMTKGIAGTSAIVAGGIPMGAGLALKQQYQEETNVTVIYFGDGAVDEGIFWETINFAGLKKLPILFVQEDNGYASQTGSNRRHAYSDILSIVGSYGIQIANVDGNDAEQIISSAEKLLEQIRRGEGPGFLRCETFRWYGHVGVEDDTPTGYRTELEVASWKKRCPVVKIEKWLETVDPKNFLFKKNEIVKCLSEKIDTALKCAKEAEYALD